MASVIITLILMTLVIYLIYKKFDPATMLLVIGVIALGAWALVTGKPIIKDSTSGSMFIDLFEFIVQRAIRQFSGPVLTVMVIMGYIGYMEKIHASELFAYIVARPLQKLHAPYLLAGLTILLGTVVKFAVPSAVSMISLLIATIYPILRQLGVSRATAASALILSGVAVWGPTDSMTNSVLGLAGVTGIPLPEFFTKYQVVPALSMLTAIVIVFIIVSKIFDKKENVVADDSIEVKDHIKELNLPWIYAIMPLFPLVFALLFSGAGIKGLTASLTAVNFFSLLLAMLIHMIFTRKNKKEAFNETKSFFLGMGKYVGAAGFLIVAGDVFASAVNNIGGLTKLVMLVNSSGGSGFLLIVFASLIFFPVIACTGSIMAAMTIFIPLFTEIATISGINPLVCYAILLFVGGLASGMTPIAAAMIVVSNTTETEIPTIMKRNIFPLLAGVIVVIPVCFLMG